MSQWWHGAWGKRGQQAKGTMSQEQVVVRPTTNLSMHKAQSLPGEEIIIVQTWHRTRACKGPMVMGMFGGTTWEMSVTSLSQKNEEAKRRNTGNNSNCHRVVHNTQVLGRHLQSHRQVNAKAQSHWGGKGAGLG